MSESKWPSPFLKQCFVTMGASLNMMSCGFTVAFTTTFLTQLKENKTNHINITDDQSSWFASINAISEIFGIILVPLLMDYFGRKMIILFGTITMAVGWICIIASSAYGPLMLGRFLQGLSMGIATILAPVLIGEYASPKNRGPLLTMISLCLFTGCLAAHSIGLVLSWKITAVIGASIPIINIMIISFSPESPSFLAVSEKYEECRKVFRWLRGFDEDKELEKLIKRGMAIRDARSQLRQTATVKNNVIERFLNAKKVIISKKNYMPLFVMFHLQLINAWNGCILYEVYAVDVVRFIVGNNVDLNATIQSVDILKILFSIIAVVIMKKMKRRTILYVTVSLNILTCILIASYTYCKSHQLLLWDHWCVGVILIHLHMFSVTVGCIPLPNIIAGEIFSLEYKGVSSLISSLFFSLNVFILVKTAPHLFTSISFSGAFCIYACIMFYSFIVLVFYLPETKDKILQDIEDDFKHSSCALENKNQIRLLNTNTEVCE